MDPASRLSSMAKTLYQSITGESSPSTSVPGMGPPQPEVGPPQPEVGSPPPQQPVASQPYTPPQESQPTVPPGGLADGQFTPEELEMLRQSGQLPPGASYAPMPGESNLIPGYFKPLPEEALLEWIAPSRPFKKPKRSFFVNLTVVCLLICLIFLFANQFLVSAVVIALLFMIYVLNSIPPRDVRHTLTTYGIRYEDELYYWEELGRFWITQSKGQNIVNIEVGRMPYRLSMLLGEIPVDDMTIILSEVLLNEAPPLTQFERWGEWLKQKVPLDLEN